MPIIEVYGILSCSPVSQRELLAAGVERCKSWPVYTRIPYKIEILPSAWVKVDSICPDKCCTKEQSTMTDCHCAQLWVDQELRDLWSVDLSIPRATLAWIYIYILKKKFFSSFFLSLELGMLLSSFDVHSVSAEVIQLGWILGVNDRGVFCVLP